MTESASTYHNKIEASAPLMEQARSIEEITPLLKDVVSTTRGSAYDIRNVGDELRDMREKVSTADA